ncbi:MAG: 16S rRNA (cytosine(967)-C(5))-methyltransferase RsmB [Eubacteriales bacterium]|nr:16S rRNA (cytosine(967)-C(5))-methyltransferase RsmB [Eubacteriales bacterium]
MSKKAAAADERDTVLRVLDEVVDKNAYLNISLDKNLRTGSLSAAGRAFVTEAATGTVRQMLLIDRIIGDYSKIKLRRISPPIMNILRMGVYQIVFMDRTPDSAACNESVRLALRYGHKASAGFVNAVLRNISTSGGKIIYPDPAKNLTGYLSLKYSHPEWMVEKWLSDYGADFTEKLLKANNRKPPFTIRTNTLKLSRIELIERLSGKGYRASVNRMAPEAVIIENPAAITETEEYASGCFFIQDAGSMLAPHILDPKPGQLAVDVCAAPGGKATHMVQLMNGKGRLIAFDKHPHRLRLLKNAAEKTGTGIIETAMYNDMTLIESLKGQADKVLADVPCTGYGVIRRKPDIKLTASPDETAKLAEQQYEILLRASDFVKPGGTLVYSTCTICPEENERVVARFLNTSSDFMPDPVPDKIRISDIFPELITGTGGFIRLFPNLHDTDGVFAARMARK